MLLGSKIFRGQIPDRSGHPYPVHFQLTHVAGVSRFTVDGQERYFANLNSAIDQSGGMFQVEVTREDYNEIANSGHIEQARRKQS